jgi:hypothetical protein
VKQLLLRLSLLVVGVVFDVTSASVKRLGLASDKSGSTAESISVVSPGDIVVSNLTNVLEVRYYLIFDISCILYFITLFEDNIARKFFSKC